MSRPSDRPSVVLEVPDGLPPLTGEAARLLLAMVSDAARVASVVELRIGRSPDEPEAVAS